MTPWALPVRPCLIQALISPDAAGFAELKLKYQAAKKQLELGASEPVAIESHIKRSEAMAFCECVQHKGLQFQARVDDPSPDPEGSLSIFVDPTPVHELVSGVMESKVISWVTFGCFPQPPIRDIVLGECGRVDCM